MNKIKTLNALLALMAIASLIFVFVVDSWESRFLLICTSVSCSTMLFDNRKIRIGGAAVALGFLFASYMQTPSIAPSIDLINSQEADRLLNEVDDLIKMDTTFYSADLDNATEHVASKDKEILAKLDSAIALAPHYKAAYMGKMMYLQQCRKSREVLLVLRQAVEKVDEPISADVLSLKAILEDIMGDSATARKDFQVADSGYLVLMEKNKDNLCGYTTFRLNRILNLTLMNNDFSLYRKEIADIRLVCKDSIAGSEVIEKFNDKQTYYRHILPRCF